MKSESEQDKSKEKKRKKRENIINFPEPPEVMWQTLGSNELGKKRFLPKSGIPGHFPATISYIIKLSTKHTPGAPLLARQTSYLILAQKGQGTSVFFYSV